MPNKYYLLPWSRSYRWLNMRQDSGSNNLVRRHKARALEVRNVKDKKSWDAMQHITVSP